MSLHGTTDVIGKGFSSSSSSPSASHCINVRTTASSFSEQPLMELSLTVNALGSLAARRDASSNGEGVFGNAAHSFYQHQQQQHSQSSIGFTAQSLAMMLKQREEGLTCLIGRVPRLSLMTNTAMPYAQVSTRPAPPLTNRGLPSLTELQMRLLLHQQHQQQQLHASTQAQVLTKCPSVVAHPHHVMRVAGMGDPSSPQTPQPGYHNMALGSANVVSSLYYLQPNSVEHTSLRIQALSKPKTEDRPLFSYSSCCLPPPSVQKEKTKSPSMNDRSAGAAQGVDPLCLVKLSFPEKIHFMLKSVSSNDSSAVVSYVDHGTAFLIHQPRIFETDVMPLYFSSNRLSSFQRQLNIYGFQRVDRGPWRGAYRHPCFLKDHPELLKKLKRCTTSRCGNTIN